VIRPALAAGQVVIADRYADATAAYQGGGRGVDRELIEQAVKAATGGLLPDLTLLLDLPVEEARKRTRSRGAPDRLDAESEAFHRRVGEAYRQEHEREPGRIKIIDARADADSVHQSILSQVLATLAVDGGDAPNRPSA
jgi:dTMP kinase